MFQLLNGDEAVVASVGASNDGALRWAVEYPDEFPLVSTIDIYGVTPIGHEQLGSLVSEWRALIDATSSEGQLAYVLEAGDLIERAHSSTSCSIRFLGD